MCLTHCLLLQHTLGASLPDTAFSCLSSMRCASSPQLKCARAQVQLLQIVEIVEITEIMEISCVMPMQGHVYCASDEGGGQWMVKASHRMNS